MPVMVSLFVEACKKKETVEVMRARELMLLDLTVIAICERVCYTEDGEGYVVGLLCVV